MCIAYTWFAILFIFIFIFKLTNPVLFNGSANCIYE